MPTGLQIRIDRERAVYETLQKPLLYQLVTLHQLSIRDFASVFGISKGHAENLLKHRTVPDLELAFRIARYFTVSVDELFGWRFDDTGDRCPTLIERNGEVVKMSSFDTGLGIVRKDADAS